jgi:Fic family protein
MRQYEETHPWITFRADLSRCSHRVWLLLGEARSKCEHIAGVPLRPEIAAELWKIYLAKGAHATTSIEGNTLSEEEVREQLDGSLKLPPSREYLAHEVANVLQALREIDDAVARGEPLRLDRARIQYFNRQILEGLELSDDVVPGELRTHSVAVGPYRGAPAEDGGYLVDRLCDWLDGPDFQSDDTEMRFAVTVAKAVLAHLYIAWIHPFADGNGRTARLVEFQILAQSGLIPLPAANLLSDHYNRTRDRYYAELQRASESGGQIGRFIEYAAQGFVDGLREQIDYIRRQQWDVAWENFVHSGFPGPDTPATRRRKHLALDMPPGVSVPRAQLPRVSPRVAEEYAAKGSRTLSRDVNTLLDMGLLKRVSPGSFQANRELILAFLQPMADPPAG